MKTKLTYLAFFVLFANTVFATIWKVEKNGLGDFSTINQALNVAQPGDTIKVFPGTYMEKIVINKDIVLQGSGAEATVIANTGDGFAVDISAGKMMWFTITSQGSGVKASGGVIANCIVKGCKYDGFEAYSGAKIINCISAQNDYGFYIPPQQKPIILNSIAYANAECGFLKNYNSGGPYSVIYCTSYGNKFNYCQDAKMSTGSFAADPQFEPSSFKISDGSPCKDSGNIAYTDPDGSPADMGYFGANDAPTFPVVKQAGIVLNPDGTVTIKATGVSSY